MAKKRSDARTRLVLLPAGDSSGSTQVAQATTSLRRVLGELQQLTRLCHVLEVGQIDTDPAIRHIGSRTWNDIKFCVTQTIPAIEALERLAGACDKALTEFEVIKKKLRDVRDDAYELKTVPDVDANHGFPFIGLSAHHVAAKIAKSFRDTLLGGAEGESRSREYEVRHSAWAVEFRKQLKQEGVKHPRKQLAKGQEVAMQICAFRLSWQVLDRLRDDLSRESRRAMVVNAERAGSTRKPHGSGELELQHTQSGGLLTGGEYHKTLSVRQYWLLRCLAEKRQKKEAGGLMTRKELVGACARTPLASQIGRSHLGKDPAWVTRALDRIELPDSVLVQTREHEVSWRLAVSVKVV
jgi:hypothetical protein